MSNHSGNPWRAIVLGSLVAALGVLSACQWTSGCLLGRLLHHESPVYSQRNGEEPMSADVRTQRGIEHADEATFDQLVLKSDVPVLVDFYADWCGPCQALAPVLEQLAGETPNARIVKVNVDHSPALAARYGVSSIPSLMVFHGGQIRAEQVGMASKSRLKAMLGV
jgi:thioredoxin 1